jgi:hypothetical protein
MYQFFLNFSLLGILLCLIIIVVYLIKYYTLFRDTNEQFTSISRNFNDVSLEVGQIIHEERLRN